MKFSMQLGNEPQLSTGEEVEDMKMPRKSGAEKSGNLYSHCFMSLRIFSSLLFFGLMLNSIFFTISVMTAAIMK